MAVIRPLIIGVGAIFRGKDCELAVYSKGDLVWDTQDLLVPGATAPAAR